MTCLQRIDPVLYLPMGQVLDPGYTFSGVDTMDLKDLSNKPLESILT
jgi:hypothetical protein